MNLKGLQNHPFNKARFIYYDVNLFSCSPFFSIRECERHQENIQSVKYINSKLKSHK